MGLPLRLALVITSALLILGCGSKREVRGDAGRDAAASRALSGLPGSDGGAPSDAGTSTPAADAGPSDDSLPPPHATDLAPRGKHLLEAIVQDNPDLASDILFPRDAFVASRDIADPTKVWEKKISGSFARDVHTLS